MKRLALFAILTIAISLHNCSDAPKPEETSGSSVNLVDSVTLVQGAKIVETQCLACHKDHQPGQPGMAPPLGRVKSHYMRGEPDFDTFKSQLISFVTAPSAEKSKMPRAIEKHGLMSAMQFSDEEFHRIATYIYYSEFKKRKRHRKQDTSMMALGKSLALETKAVLGKNLMKAIQTKGSSGAVSFCSTRAIHLTDSVANKLNASIKRVSDKTRNPNNKANEQELAYIKKTKEALAKGGKPKPKMTGSDGEYTGYYPILTNNMCLQCHGKEADINAETKAKIAELYPNDLATGYGANELRGIWVVTMNNNTDER